MSKMTALKSDFFKSVKQAIRDKFAWPGGYDILFTTCGGETICAKCARENYREICTEHVNGSDCGWRIGGMYLSCELDGCYCDNCNAFFGTMTKEEYELHLERD